MIEHNDLHAGLDICQVVFQPLPAVVFIVARGIVRTGLERCDNIVDVAHIERIPHRTINALKERLSIFPSHIVVIADHIAHGNTHILRIHILDMLLQAILIADIARVDEEGRVGFLHRIPDMLNPRANTLCANFRIGNLQEGMIRLRGFLALVQPEIIGFPILCNRNVIVFRPVARGRCYRDEAALAVARQGICAVFIRFDHVAPV